MNKTLITGLLALIILGGVWWFGKNESTESPDSVSNENAVLGNEIVTIYKSSSCGYCGVYAQYLDRENVLTKVENVTDMSAIKKEHGIPPQLESCHTSLVGGYFIEGHVPLSVIERLLAEKPDITGIALPGMPSGSPGMPGPQTEPWVIYAIQRDGSVTEFMTI